MEFEFTAKEIKTGRKTSGKREAENERELLQSLRRQELVPLKVRRIDLNQGRRGSSLFHSGKVRSRDLVFFTRQLAAVMKAGLLITEALQIVAVDLSNKYFQSVIMAVHQDIIAGNSFSSSLKKYPHVFPGMYLNLIETGEASGTLEKGLQDLAKYLEECEEIRDKIKTGLTYPMFLIGFTFAIIIAVFLFIIPKFQKIFEDSGNELPVVTQMVSSASAFVFNNVYYLLGGIVLSIFVISLLLRIRWIQEYVDDMKLNIPYIGPEILHKSLLSRFCRTFGVMLGGGITMNAALTTMSEIFESRSFRKVIDKVKDRVVSGSSLSDEIHRHKIFPPLVGKMVLIGEKTGRFEEMLLQTAYYYDEQIANNTKRLLVLIEPAMIIFCGIFICFIIVAIYLPIFNMINVVNF